MLVDKGNYEVLTADYMVIVHSQAEMLAQVHK